MILREPSTAEPTANLKRSRTIWVILWRRAKSGAAAWALLVATAAAIPAAAMSYPATSDSDKLWRKEGVVMYVEREAFRRVSLFG